ncbi:glycine-rich domain-containing protein [Achromobacter animicus]|uniref:glycine-rich domain-containing protein n=1 Tax=Achromobacter animicus TaxID=1389935 RepID=UPI0028B04DE4|nr:hypothetical protein [Achromobacter animicus]
MATRIYKTPFAATGDKEVLATADQPDGKVSLQAGWTPDYELPNDNANYRPVGRAEMNGILSEVTEGLGEMQLNGFATWQDIEGGWPLGAQVSHGGTVYKSTVADNVAVPGPGVAGWQSANAGTLLRTSVYRNSGGTQQVSVDGGAFTSTGAGTFNKLSGANSAIVEVLGGGGGGGGAQANGAGATSSGAGGGSGAYGKTRVFSGLTGVVVAVGAAGAAGSASSGGGSGGTSSFGALVTAPGGAGGALGLTTSGFPLLSQGGARAATATGANIVNSPGSPGGSGLTLALNKITDGQGAASVFGGGGGSPIAGGPGNDGGAYGAGGGGGASTASQAGQPGGAGGSGVIIVQEFA